MRRENQSCPCCWLASSSRVASPGCISAPNWSARHNLLLINAARVSELERLTVRNGSTFEGIKVQKVERDCLTISYHPRRGGVGVVRVGFKDLPEQLQEKYGFDTLNKGASAGPDQLEAIVLAAL